MIHATIFKIQRHSLYDGPGIRTAVFFKGCPLSCIWCFNPESQSGETEVVHSQVKCIGCGLCLEACPVPGAVHSVAESMVAPLSDGGGLPIGDENSGPRKYTIDKHICNDCGACTEVCPAGACTSIGYTVEVGELAARLERDRVFFEKSGGGITLSGGEVTSQPKFAASLLEECRKRGLHTAIETCGYVQWKTLLDLYSNTDLVLYDIKLLDPARHRRYTGVDNGIILENAVRTAQLGIPMVVRVPIIPGYNDAPEDLDELAAFVSQRLHGVDTIHLLPYETLGKAKYERLGKQYLLSHDEPPNTKQMQVAAERIEAQGLNVRIGG